uniref:GTPase IMAP family member 8 n=1 Tax=Knipowitschia caucasica TaxID=637954 RepID=A0AAV2J4H2_KNICA
MLYLRYEHNHDDVNPVVLLSCSWGLPDDGKQEGDNLIQLLVLKEVSLEDFILEDDVSPLPDIFTRLQKRHHVFDNEAWGPEQVQGLLQTINTEFFPGLGPAVLDLGPADHDLGPAVLDLGPADLDLGPAALDLAELRLVLIGLPGAGKSSSGNTILGQNLFKASCGFDPVNTQAERKTGTVLGREVTVVDTPGFSDVGIRPKKLFKRIMKSVLELTKGPHAFIIVVRLGRVHCRDTKLLRLIPKLFDKTASKFTMVLFTHGDNLGTENVDVLIDRNTTMSTLVQMCQRRYCVFYNKSSNRHQVHDLFQQISIMVEASGHPQCDSQIFKLTTAAEIKLFLEELWEKCKAKFTSCFRPNKDDEDEERVPLTNMS